MTTVYAIRSMTPREQLLFRRLRMLAASRETAATMRSELLAALQAHLEREGFWGEEDQAR